MKRIFLDTNVLIDYIDNRPGAEAAQQIFEEANSGRIILLASTLTFANFAYVVKRHHSQEEVYSTLNEMEKRVEALPMDRQQLRSAINFPSKDFEDMLQYQCALAGNCDIIVTRNIKDFSEFSIIPLMTSERFIESLRESSRK